MAHIFVNGKTIILLIAKAALAQGDPIPSILFFLLVVPLHLSLDETPSPFCIFDRFWPFDITIPSTLSDYLQDRLIFSLLTISFADDFTTATCNISNIETVLGIYDDFGKVSSLQIEKHKTIVASNIILSQNQCDSLLRLGLSDDLI